MSVYVSAKDELSASLSALAKAAQQLHEPALAQAANGEVERLDDGRLVVVVCGEFKVGKSSLINALLGLDLSPVDFDIATSSVIMIRQGPALRAYVSPADGGPPREIAIADIPRVASESQRRSMEEPPRAVLIDAPAPFLEGGVTLVDTPGVGGLNHGHSEITFAVMAEADLVLFVSDAQAPLTTHELDFIGGRILPLNQSFALVQTKIDLQPRIDEIVRANQQKLRPVLEHEPTILKISSRLKGEHARSGDVRDLTESGFPALEEHVSRVLRSSGQERIIARAARAAESVGEKLIEPRRVELLAINGRGSPEFLAMQHNLKETTATVERLRQDRANWRSRLNFEISELRERAVSRGLAHRLVEIDTEFRAKANNTTAAGDELETIARRLEADVKHAFAATCREIAEGVENTRLALATETGLPLTPIVRDTVPDIVGARPLHTEKTKGWATKIGDWANQWRRQLIGGATIGALAGGMIGGALGLFAGGAGAIPGFVAGMQLGAGLGAAGGAVTGIPSANKYVENQAKSRARETLEGQLAPYLRLASKECTDRCIELIAELKEALVREFDLRIKDMLTDLSRQDEALQRGLAAEREAMVARKEALIAELRAIEPPLERARRAAAAFRSSAL